MEECMKPKTFFALFHKPCAVVFCVLCAYLQISTGSAAASLRWEGVWAEKKSWCANGIGEGDKSAVRIDRKKVIYDPVNCVVTKVISANDTSFKLKLRCTMTEESTETWEQTVSGRLGDTLKVDTITNPLHRCN
jgi:hypothetical protein